MKTRESNKGISLIVLVITIIVMIILATAVVITLNNSGIIGKANEAVAATNLKQVQELATILWAEAYIDSSTSKDDLATAVINGLEENNIDVEEYKINVTETGVTVAENPVPAKWRDYVSDIVDNVPIPKRFVVSPYDGENTKNEGLVIYELNQNETEIPSSETQFESWTTRNQYVWVPVYDFSEFKRKDSINATSLVVNESEKYYALGSADVYWEAIVNESTNLPYPTMDGQDSAYMSNTTLQEVQAMYASVKEYGGFFVSRYEIGIDSARNETNYKDSEDNWIYADEVYSVMGKIPYNWIPWSDSSDMSEDEGGAVEISRAFYSTDVSNTSGVVSTLIYSVQWDRVLDWWEELDSNLSATASTDYGNYYDHAINEGDLNLDAKFATLDSTTYLLGEYEEVAYTDGVSDSVKTGGAKWLLSTGALKQAKVYNIYDMAGNVYEWTMEGKSTGNRTIRGGHFGAVGSERPAAYRSSYNAAVGDHYVGFRTSLYIKK